MQTNENGWPIAPERGRYIGFVYDISTVKEGGIVREGEGINLISDYQYNCKAFLDELNKEKK